MEHSDRREISLTPVRIPDLDIDNQFKRALSYLMVPRSIYAVMDLLGRSYPATHQMLKVWEERGWVIAHPRHKGEAVRWEVNHDRIRP